MEVSDDDSKIMVKSADLVDGASLLSPSLRSCRSAMMGGKLANLLVGCCAFALDMEAIAPMADVTVRKYEEENAQGKGKGMSVYVMMLLDSVMVNHAIKVRIY
ncbi:hypothetical protein FNV43_RR10465 [Rhamnella rubrinervis]|uniref:Uncharacterized protein n=1 Tax=Rhamnella rubrinervis TaxID=2594499 RepID=A0A8K0MKT2_9ROSA|nr:hypothetical protein FNV43_RR10465 [Rhamnella rubrinervis]